MTHDTLPPRKQLNYRSLKCSYVINLSLQHKLNDKQMFDTIYIEKL